MSCKRSHNSETGLDIQKKLTHAIKQFIIKSDLIELSEKINVFPTDVHAILNKKILPLEVAFKIATDLGIEYFLVIKE